MEEHDDEDDEDDEEEEGGGEGGEKPSGAAAALAPPPPLLWGVPENNPECLVISSTPQPGLSPFPAGCFYESSPSSFPSSASEGSKSRIDQFSRRAASKATREVLVARGGGGGGGRAGVRPLQYKTRSGKDLKVVE